MASTDLRIAAFPDPLYAQNARVVAAEGAPQCWLIDPGLPPAAGHMVTCVQHNDFEPQAIVLTHAHADHIAGIPEILKVWPGLPVYLARAEWSFLTEPSENLSIHFGLELRVEVPDLRDLAAGMAMPLGTMTWKILDTAGHSPGGRTLYNAEAGLAIVGDSLFAGSVGRMDFPHSDGPLLLRNIREQLLVLPGDTQVLSGHGPDTTIDQERRYNPVVGECAQPLW